MSQPFVGEIRTTGHNFAPRGWAFCDGSVLAINDNTTLFALIGTMYGGNGQTTFALPDLRGRVVIGTGQGPGSATNYALGQTGGTEQVTLTANQLPAHTHTLRASSSSSGAVSAPAGLVPSANTNSGVFPYAAGTATPLVSMAATAVSTVVGNQPHENMPPFLCLSHIIALEGIFPSRA
jgi:microcystin-dependent protein